MKKIVIATNNKNKIKEISQILKLDDTELLSLADLNLNPPATYRPKSAEISYRQQIRDSVAQGGGFFFCQQVWYDKSLPLLP